MTAGGNRVRKHEIYWNGKAESTSAAIPSNLHTGCGSRTGETEPKIATMPPGAIPLVNVAAFTTPAAVNVAASGRVRDSVEAVWLGNRRPRYRRGRTILRRRQVSQKSAEKAATSLP